MESNNTKQAAWVAVGSFFSFIVGIVSPMILSRYFTKGDYGTYKQVMFVYNTLLTVFTLGLPRAYAYFLPKVPAQQAKDVIRKITWIFVFLGAVFTLFLFFCAGVISDFLKNPELEPALKLFAPTPMFLLPTMGIEGIYATYKKTKTLAFYTIFSRILTIVFTVLPVLIFKGTYIHALVGFDVASLLTCIIALYMKSLPVKNVDFEKTDLSYKQIFDFAVPLLLASLWGMLISSANQFFISRYYGNEVFAEFSNGFMEIPIAGMVLGAIGTVLLPLFSGMDEGKGLSKESFTLWKSCLIKSAKLMFPVLLYCVFFAKIVMTCLYSDLYENSTTYFQIKNISAILHIVPFAPLILAIGKTKEYSYVHMAVAVLIITLEYITVHVFSSAIAIAVVSELCQFIKVMLMMVLVAKYASTTVMKMLPKRALIKVLFVSTLSGLISYMALLPITVNKYLLFAFSLALYVIVYYALCWLFRLSYKSIVTSFFKSSNKNILRLIP